MDNALIDFMDGSHITLYVGDTVKPARDSIRNRVKHERDPQIAGIDLSGDTDAAILWRHRGQPVRLYHCHPVRGMEKDVFLLPNPEAPRTAQAAVSEETALLVRPDLSVEKVRVPVKK